MHYPQSVILRGFEPHTGVSKMKIRLNEGAVDQLTSIMSRTGYTNPTHCVQVMLSTIYNNLNKQKHKSPTSEDSNGNQSSKSVHNL
jgi:hypothetical protein